ATAVPRNDGGGSGESSPQCCQQVTKASGQSAAGVLALLGIVRQDLNVLVGLNCSPITVVGGGITDFHNLFSSGTSVSCTDNSHGGLIDIGCVPVTV
ncbi:hypothetical protein L218DRAFT_871219, partial [Marasmius fiardii PR-910]